MNESIRVFKGKTCWTLGIKKRFDYTRPTINEGWTEFRDALQLQVGDVCVFRKKKSNVKKFSVQIIKKV